MTEPETTTDENPTPSVAAFLSALLPALLDQLTSNKKASPVSDVLRGMTLCIGSLMDEVADTRAEMEYNPDDDACQEKGGLEIDECLGKIVALRKLRTDFEEVIHGVIIPEDPSFADEDDNPEDGEMAEDPRQNV